MNSAGYSSELFVMISSRITSEFFANPARASEKIRGGFSDRSQGDIPDGATGEI